MISGLLLQELQVQVDREASSAKTERKKRETAERASKQAVEDKASVVSTLAEHGQQVAQLQAAARRQERLADERLLRAEHQIAAMAQARRELDNKVRHDCSNAFISMLYRLGLGPSGAVWTFCGTRSCAVWYYVCVRYAAVTIAESGSVTLRGAWCALRIVRCCVRETS